MAVTVRPYQKKDRAYVEQICIATAGPGFAETPYRERAAVAAFCRYFITHCPETCFVAADGSDIPVGYILCAPSFADWCFSTIFKLLIFVFSSSFALKSFERFVISSKEFTLF